MVSQHYLFCRYRRDFVMELDLTLSRLVCKYSRSRKKKMEKQNDPKTNSTLSDAFFGAVWKRDPSRGRHLVKTSTQLQTLSAGIGVSFFFLLTNDMQQLNVSMSRPLHLDSIIISKSLMGTFLCVTSYKWLFFKWTLFSTERKGENFI